MFCNNKTIFLIVLIVFAEISASSAAPVALQPVVSYFLSTLLMGKRLLGFLNFGLKFGRGILSNNEFL